MKTVRTEDPEGYKSAALRISLTVSVGVVEFHTFKIDVTEQRRLQEPPEICSVSPVIDTLMDTPVCRTFTIRVTPVESHLADKICAMYELHPSGVSNRYHDLADIITIIRTQKFSGAELKHKLKYEALRRGVELPGAMMSPGEKWEAEFPGKARGYAGFPSELQNLDRALNYAGHCLNPVLGGTLRSGVHWNHQTRKWEGSSAIVE
ncbi:nucleotidyl transferase AbiEii/AbiGii toxin family protein [Corynebacterium cystitidis]|uniref:nucleotidyl transferase AbiEii/AbiGii toxin family protein n=1 Tax=Corynebacterium cystitidis TaxID=35757 RepID=UPI00211F30D3|nr:nucleotidyl transferase AbiEii/AbiGii toxin family protein [Corynebacterium cystitidis]